MIGFTDKKQGLHDYMAHSISVYKDQKNGPNKAVVISMLVLNAVFILVGTFLLVGLVIISIADSL